MDITEQLTHESRIALAAAAEITRLRAEVDLVIAQREAWRDSALTCQRSSAEFAANADRRRAEVEALRARIATRCDFARLLIQKDAMLDIAQGSLDAARAEVESLRSPVARPLAEWHEDMGPVLWWKFPIMEPPYCGRPDDCEWSKYFTHWTPIVVPSNAGQKAPCGECHLQPGEQCDGCGARAAQGGEHG